MKRMPDSLQTLDDRDLLQVQGGGKPGFSLSPWSALTKPSRLDAPGSFDLPGGPRDHQQAAAQAQFGSMVRANPAILAPPQFDFRGDLLRQRILSGSNQPQFRRP